MDLTDSSLNTDSPNSPRLTTSFSLDFDPLSFKLTESENTTSSKEGQIDLSYFDPHHHSSMQADSLEVQTYQKGDASGDALNLIVQDSLQEHEDKEIIAIENRCLDVEEKYESLMADSLNEDLHISEGKNSPAYFDEDDVVTPECNVDADTSEDHSPPFGHKEESIQDLDRPEELVSVAKLKNAYTSNVQQEPAFSTPTKEIIETGVNIESIKSNLSTPNEESQVKESDFLQTNISVRTLSSTFTSTPKKELADEPPPPPPTLANGTPIPPEELKLLSIDKDMLALKFSQNASEECHLCKICKKPVYQMEKIFAEKNFFHKFCFRCQECNKTLNVDTYCSHNGQLFCKLHFRQLFQPQTKPVETKSDDGLEKIPDLHNLRSKFESPRTEQSSPSANTPSDISTINRLGDRMAKYQMRASGEMEEKVSDEEPIKEVKEKPIPVNMSSLKQQWETGSITSSSVKKEEKTDELEELEQLRPILHSESFKSMYVNACQEANKIITSRGCSESLELSEEARAQKLRDIFEKGKVVNDLDVEKQEKNKKEIEEDLSFVNETTIATDARNLFKQIDAAGVKPPTPTSPLKQLEAKKNILNLSPCDREKLIGEERPESPKKDDPILNSEEEQDSTDADPNIVKASDSGEEIPVIDTTRRMLGVFQALESRNQSQKVTSTYVNGSSAKSYSLPSSTPSKDPTSLPEIVKASYKSEENLQVEACITKNMKAKFERLEVETQENKKNEENSTPKTHTRSLRAMFELSREEEAHQSLEKQSKAKVNRFIEQQASLELCDICQKKLYPMEKMETSGLKLHKNCFKCVHCSCILRLENYTTSGGKLYCTPHFKQLFIVKGNYDEGFGREQHKEKWNRSRSNTPVSRDDSSSAYSNGITSLAIDMVA